MARSRLLLVALSACKFSANAASDAPHAIDTKSIDSQMIDASIDAPPPPACTGMSATCLNAVTLSTCSGPNATPVVSTCSWGCVSTGTAHCGQLAAHGGAVQSSDFTAQGGAPLTLGTIKFNTMDGTTMPATTGYTAVLRGNVMVFRFSGLTITGSVSFVGPNAAAFVADGAIAINGIVDVRGPCANNTKNAGPGGFNGGNGDNPGSGMGAGAAQTGKNDGGGGAGYGAAGGTGNGGTAGGASYGDQFISVLVGGSGGGGGHNGGHVGGGGGGALQLASNTSVSIGNSGGINAGGCGGGNTANDGNGGGGGGGAGGAILIEAPVVTVDGSLAVNGGAGGGDTTNGAPGGLDRNMAANGDGGGAGGAAATPAGQPAAANPGGGGGAVGRIRLESRTGTVQVNGLMSPALQDPGTTSTAGAANVQ
ncbi:MAG: hypothetical protein JO257_37865 [Deltaproteobacteria bacterium]|nr:hypothetical protein [Deltaproteobacteria bacterium]